MSEIEELRARVAEVEAERVGFVDLVGMLRDRLAFAEARVAEVEEERDQARLEASIWELRVVEAAEYGEVLEAELVDVARSRDEALERGKRLAHRSAVAEGKLAEELRRRMM